jgi:hypothetical protein
MCNELNNKEKQALRSIPIGTIANNNQTLKYNSSTKKFEFTNAGGGGGGGGIGDAVLAGENNFTGQNFFANDVYIGTDSLGDDTKKVATLGSLSAYASLTANDQVFGGLGTSFTNPIFIGNPLDKFVELQTKQQVIDAISGKADTSVLSNYAAKASANTFTANQTINANLAVGGTFTATARHHVRGDGTNPIARFESAAGQNILTVRESDHTMLFGSGVGGIFPQIGLQNLANPLTFALGNGQYLGYKSSFNRDWPSPMHSFWGENQIYSTAPLSNNHAGIAAFNGTFGISNVAASTFDYRILGINYTINNTATSNRNATGIFVNATQTNLNGMTHNLLDLQVNSGSTFRVNNSGTVFNPSGGNYNNGQFGSLGKGFITFVNNGTIRLDNASENGFGILQFGGNTVDRPAIKPNGAALDFVLANDTGFATIRANAIIANSLIRCAASTTNSASFNIPAGTAPTTPTNGDIWLDGTDNGLKIRINGVTRTITIS